MSNMDYKQYMNALYDSLVGQYLVITISNECSVITDVYSINNHLTIRTKNDSYMINDSDNRFLSISDIIRELGLSYGVTVMPVSVTSKLLKEEYDRRS